MPVTISTLDRFKVETEFGDGYVVQITYDWEFSERRLKETATWTDVKLLGSGAFGSVWLEQKKDGGQLRAVKKLRRESVVKTGFAQELGALVTLADYKHLFVEFFGWYESRSEIFLAMEYIRYGDLSEYMKDNKKARVEAREITRQILEGLAILHGEGICHRDLKPQNILVASRDPIWVKLADFGTSKRTNNTFLRTMCGTRAYLAPEVQGLLPRKFKTGLQFSYALDLWSLGCVVYELLTSQIPFLEIADEEEYDNMTGLDSDFESLALEIDIQSLHEYCQGLLDFPSELLQISQVTEEGINFVKSLMVPNPKERATAANALQNPWVVNTGYRSDWFNSLQQNFSDLGIDLDLSDRALMRQLRSADIARALPTTANLDTLLTQAAVKGFRTATSILLRSPSRHLTISCDVLIEAAAREWTKIVQLILDNKADVNSRSSDGRTALQAAVEGGNIVVVKLLLNNGADMHSRFSDGRTPWIAAVEGGNIGILKLLLGMQADVNARFSDGRTALQVAVERGNIEVVTLLLANNADVDTQCRDGRTALLAAINGRNIEIVTLLLANKADVNIRFSNARTAWQAAISSGSYEIVKLLLDSKVNFEAGSNDPSPALHIAARSGDISMVKYLLDNNADINSWVFHTGGRTPLQAAAGGGHLDVVKFLVDNKALVNADPAENKGRTALQAAAEGGHIDVVKFLVDNKADINARPALQGGMTALQAAAEGGHIDVVKFLVENKADINAPPAWRGMTALQAAARGGHIDRVKFFMDNEALIDVEGSEFYGRTALQAAAEGGHIDVVKFLVENKADINAPPAWRGMTALQAAAGGGNIYVMKFLAEDKADINAPRAWRGMTALQAAAGGGHIDVVKFLVENKADINAPPVWRGMTALQAAARGGHVGLVKFFMDNEALVNAEGSESYGRTALQAAAEEGHIDVVKFLLDNNAHINYTGGSSIRVTAYEIAVKCKQKLTAELLLQRGANSPTWGS